jgi:precorrin-2 dehydrogenase / sirohydrochlorin ferrochelatase
MGYIPIFLDLAGRRCVIVGGGEVAARKAESILAAGARVTIVSPSLSAPSLVAAVERGLVTHIARAYQRGDIAGCVLAYAATDDPALNRALADEARALGILLNVVDVPELCSFIAPAVVKRGALQIAVSTGGASPAFAARLRRELEKQFGIEYGVALKVLRAARNRLRGDEIDPAERMRRLKELAESRLLDAIVARDPAELDEILGAHLGDGVTLAALGLDAAALGIAQAPEVRH